MIQARYASITSPSGEAPSVVQALAAGGPFLKGHTLVVEVGGGVTWDGQPILQSFPSSFNVSGLIQSTFSSESEHVDPGLRGLVVRSVDATLPLGVRLTVNRWPEHLDVLLAMRPLLGGQDGHCGNFNGDASDDSARDIRRRQGAEVSEEDSLLRAKQQAA